MGLKDEELTPQQIEIQRRMTPTEKLAVADSLYRTAWSLKVARLQMLHPEWTREQIDQEVRRIFVSAHT